MWKIRKGRAGAGRQHDRRELTVRSSEFEAWGCSYKKEEPLWHELGKAAISSGKAVMGCVVLSVREVYPCKAWHNGSDKKPLILETFFPIL